ncbi:MAG: 2-succinyl-5-enolpyruvyl-6-hydroxy-3-cyclohexene-1-carboxylic-acid synthase [Candidatus Anaerobiospirillum merdipullorum]|uniref:2-succinyl-5-enolpyruvyl-6-hydroxy-3-cyclohexene-1-carboxylate synthase n=1 Tax=Candidatus Anaerobiospirillum merdipullorum TaxID=2838450 RepID=A0A9E2KNX5_9GAMM|nr:2-succinyl-5-enolpyruvyl-6-hydroxy-3-cyclohexene-1-carboxylic-acid synthase [Candidatus Anaerobiospirillum merdipullorum]
MFSSKENVLLTLALLRAYGIKQAVLCPGSRDIPLVQGLAQCHEISCHSFTDERAAGFAAIGLILQTKAPCAVVVTSGSALLNLHPAVCEAYYRHLPLLIISADRAAAWIGQNDGQTLPQINVFNSLVKYCGQACEVKDKLDAWHCERTIKEALLALTTPPFAPVQLNVPIGDPFFDFSVATLPVLQPLEAASLADLPTICARYRRIALILSASDLDTPPTGAQQEALAARFVIIAEQLSNAQQACFLNYPELWAGQLLKQDATAQAQMAPDLVITLGGQILSKALKRYLRLCDCDHLDLSADGTVADVFMHERYIIKASYSDALHALCALPQEKLAPPYLAPQDYALKTSPNRVVLPYSHIGMLQRLLNALPPHSVLHLANSSTVRYAAYFALPPQVRVYANRGVNGIEGSLSTAVGAALADPEHLHFVCIGDLSFFYDLNALWTRGMVKNLRVILFNNSGGEIFAALPGLKLDARAANFVTAPHQTSALPWAQSCGFKVATVTSAAQMDALLPKLQQTSAAPYLVEVMTKVDDDLAAVKQLTTALITTN